MFYPLSYGFKTPLSFIDFSRQKLSVSLLVLVSLSGTNFHLSFQGGRYNTQITFCHPFLSQIPTGFQESYGKYGSLNLFPHSTQLTTFLKLNVLLQKLNLLKIKLFLFLPLPSPKLNSCHSQKCFIPQLPTPQKISVILALCCIVIYN